MLGCSFQNIRTNPLGCLLPETRPRASLKMSIFCVLFCFSFKKNPHILCFEKAFFPPFSAFEISFGNRKEPCKTCKWGSSRVVTCASHTQAIHQVRPALPLWLGHSLGPALGQFGRCAQRVDAGQPFWVRLSLNSIPLEATTSTTTYYWMP